MKICICSDIHGNVDATKEMLALVQPDVVLFLGDGIGDFADATKAGTYNCFAVSGNCDLNCDEVGSRVIELCGKRIFMTHGHHYQVKCSTLMLKSKACSVEADIALFGHTHMQYGKYCKNMLLINPGSLGYSGNFCILTIDSNGNIQYEHKTLERR